MMIGRLKLSSIFTNDMVVPFDKSFRISGSTEANVKVIGILKDQCVATYSNSQGSFTLEFHAVNVQGDDLLRVLSNDTECTRTVHFGQTYLFSGQSNIEFRLKDTLNYQQILNNFPRLKAYYFETPQVEYVSADGHVKPENAGRGKWEKISADNCGDMSAIAFYAAVEMQQNNPNMIIGIVDCYKGGTSASVWIPRESLRKSSQLSKAYLKPFNDAIGGKTNADFNQEQIQYQKKVEIHNRTLAKFIAENPEVSLSDAKDHVGHTPWPPPMEPTSYLRPGGLFHTMMPVVSPFTFDQMIWYQGENDSDHAELYAELLQLLLNTWRIQLGDDTLLVNLIQLPGYADEPRDAWAMIRQAQLQVANTLQNVRLISIIDTGEKHNIHPTDKAPIGKRIGRFLMDEKAQSPLPSVSQWTRDRLEIDIKGSRQLKFKGTPVFQGKTNDGEWVSIVPSFEKKKLVINGDYCVVKYQYENFPRPTIFNELCLPLAAFKIEREIQNYGLRINFRN